MRESGSERATRVVCVHGAGAGGWEWDIWARVFGARGMHVLAPDLVAVEAGLAATRFADYRAQVLAWCRGSGTPTVMVGASLGGLLALSVAREVAPVALVLVNPLPPAGIVATARHAPAPAVVPWGSARSPASTLRAMPDADAAARAYALRRWRDESAAVIDDARAGIRIDAPDCPVLIIASELDRDVPMASSRVLAASLAADIELIAQASHVGPLLGRNAARCAERVCDWLGMRCGPVMV